MDYLMKKPYCSIKIDMVLLYNAYKVSQNI